MSTLDTGVTLAPGAYAVMLSESSPAGAMLINTGSSRVWVGSNSNVGPSNGIPLEGETSLALNPGELWVVLDSAATSSATVYLSSRPAGAWQASPAVVATETAQELLLTGVPNVFNGTLLTGDPTVAPIDVSAFGTTVVAIGSSWLATPGTLTFTWTDDVAGLVLAQKTVPIGATAGVQWGGTVLTLTLAVYGPRLSISYSGTISHTGPPSPIPAFRVYGTNRVYPDALGPQMTPAILQTGAVAMAASTAYPFKPNAHSGASDAAAALVMAAGRYYVRLTVSSSTTAAGNLQLLTSDGAAGTTALTLRDWPAGTTATMYFEYDTPGGVFCPQWLSGVAGTFRITAEFTPSSF